MIRSQSLAISRHVLVKNSKRSTPDFYLEMAIYNKRDGKSYIAIYDRL
ncbi:MAG: hypothetical protein WBB29_11295 [Geitlerinemataceae cyanobacterium]